MATKWNNARFRVWPNKLGVDYRTSRGVWQLGHSSMNGPGLTSDKWYASFFPPGATFAARWGNGETWQDAIAAARQMP